jgi:hypothetical protein
MKQARYPSNRFHLPSGRAWGAPSPCSLLPRPAYAMSEAVLAFAILGIALAGMSPFVVTQLRLIHKLETRFQGNPVTRGGEPFFGNQPANTYYSVPWKNPRMQSLFGRAAITAGSATITDAQGNAVDDYTNTYQGSPVKANKIIIYNYTFSFTDMTSDPSSVVVNLDVEPSS